MASDSRPVTRRDHTFSVTVFPGEGNKICKVDFLIAVQVERHLIICIASGTPKAAGEPDEVSEIDITIGIEVRG